MQERSPQRSFGGLADGAGMRIQRRHFPVWIVLVLGTIVSVLLFYVLRKGELERRRQIFKDKALPLLQMLPEKLEDRLSDLDAIRRFYNGSEFVERAEFGEFVDPLLKKNPDLKSVEWLPQVSLAEKEACEALAKKDGLKSFRITELSPQGGLKPASQRDEYYPALYIEPLAGSKESQGFDMASTPSGRLLLEEARDKGLPVVSRRFSSTSNAHGFMVCVPVYRRGEPADSIEERRESVSGFIIGVFDARDLIQGLAEEFDTKGLCMELSGLSGAPGRQTLYLSPDSCHDSGMEEEKKFAFGERQWVFICRATPEFISANPSMASWLGLFMGLVATLSLAFAIAKMEGRHEFLSSLLEGRNIPELREAISIRWLTGVSLGLAMALPFAAFLVWLKLHYMDDEREACKELAGQASVAWENMVEWNSGRLSCLVRSVQESDGIADAWARRDRKALLSMAKPLFDRMKEGFGVNVMNFIEPDGTCFLRVHDPERHGDAIQRQTLADAIRLDKDVAGIERGVAGRLDLRRVHAWKDHEETEGFIELGMDSAFLAGKTARILKADLVAVMFKESLDQAQFEEGKKAGMFQGKWDDFKDFVVLKSTSGPPPSGLADFRLGPGWHGAGDGSFALHAKGRSWLCRFLPVKDCSGREVAGLVVMRDLARNAATERKTVLTAIIAAAFLSLLLFVAVSSIAARIERRLLTAVIAREREEEARSEMQERLAATLHSIGDGVISTDTAGVITGINAAAEAMTGWSASEAEGKSVKEVFRIINSKTREEAKVPVEQVLNGGAVVGLANHTALISKDGTERQIADSAAPICSKSGKVIGTVLVFSDVTEAYRMRESIAQSEERLKGIFQAVPAGIGTALDRVIKEGNERLFEMTGYSEGELIGSSSRMLYLSEEDFQYVGRQYEVAREKGIATIESKWRRKDGGVIDVIICLSAVSPSGFERGVIFSALDITERKKAELELRQSEARFRSLFDNMAEGVALHKLVRDQDGKPVNYVITEVNAQYERILGLSKESVAGKAATEAYKTQSPPYLDIYAEVAKSGRPQLFETLFKPMARHFEISAAAWGEDGFATIFTDISRRKEVENDLRKSEERYRTLVENIDLGITLVDANYRILMVNNSGARLFNKRPEDFIGGKCYEKYERRDFVCPHCPGRLAMDTGEPAEAETFGVRDDGSKFRVRIRNFALKDETGKSLGFIEVAEDITKSRETEERQRHLEQQLAQARKMESVGRLAGGIAHDFNNMLTPILGYAGMLLNAKSFDEGEKAKLGQIVRAALRARDLTRHLLAFGRKQTFEIKPISLNKVVAGFEKMLQRTIRENVPIETRLAPDLGSIEGDEGQVEQIILNLALNAQDAMPDGGVLVIETANVHMDEASAQAHEDMAEGDYVMLAVSDSGTGMDKATVERIFEPFFTTKELGKGTGLGLSTVYGIVKQLRGCISVYSEPGRGSVFKLYFPRAEKPHEDAALEVQERKRELSGGSGTVLVVEDQDNVRRLACEILELNGYAVLEAESGDKALAAAASRKGPIHLLLTDVVMPGMNGKELYELLSASRKGLKVLYMSGYTNNLIGLRGVLEPGVNFIQKPFTIDALMAKVREVLGGVARSSEGPDLGD